MDGSHQLCPQCAGHAENAIANIRKLLSDLRLGHISPDQFVDLSARVEEMYDRAIANRKLTVQMSQGMETGGSGAGRHRAEFSGDLHNPSCGCDWCTTEAIGRYRGHLVDDTSTPGSKVTE